MDALIKEIYRKKCIPFIGPEAHLQDPSLEKFTPRRSIDIAATWKNDYKYPLIIREFEEYYKKAREDYNYPLEDSHILAEIAQYLAIENDELSPKLFLRDELENKKPPNFALPEYKNTVFSILADLKLPIYITTNYDHFMEAALESNGRAPVSEFCRWNEGLEDSSRLSGIYEVFDEEYDPKGEGLELKYRPPKGSEKYKPTPDQPLVYHLLGIYEYPSSMVLTEKDYIDFVIDLNKKDLANALPSQVVTPLNSSMLLFLGYRLEDITFRVIFQGLFKLFATAQRTNLASVAVQLPPKGFRDEAEIYLKKYTKRMYSVNVSWESVQQFCVKLREEFYAHAPTLGG